jgi:hypothetical protein
VVRGECGDEFELGGGKSGVAEQRQPTWQIGGRITKASNGFAMPDVGRLGFDTFDERPPQRRLPFEIAVEVGRPPFEPVDEQLWPLPGVRREEPSDASCDGVTPTLPELLLAVDLEVPEVGGQRLAPSLAEAFVDGLQ